MFRIITLNYVKYKYEANKISFIICFHQSIYYYFMVYLNLHANVFKSLDIFKYLVEAIKKKYRAYVAC